MSRIRGSGCRWLAQLAVVCLFFAVIVVPRPVRGIVVFSVGSETMVQGSSNGWGNEAFDDGVVNVKSEATGGSTQVNVTLLPDGDGLNEWSSFTPCQTDAIAFDELNDENDATCRNTIHTNPPTPPFDWDSSLATTMQDFTPLGTILDYDVTGIARIRQDAFQFAWLSASFGAPGCSGNLGDTGGSATYVTVTAFFELCGGSEWTEAQINGLSIRSTCPADPGSQEICYTTQHKAVVGITYGLDYSLNFTSHFPNVVGPHLYLRWNCTTIDAEGLDLYVDGVRFAQGVCLSVPQGSMALPDIGAARDVNVILTSPTSTGDSTESAYTFDELVIVNDDRLPSASAGADQAVLKNTLVTLNGSASSDPDGDTLSYLWQQVSGPSITLSGGTTAIATFTPALSGTYSFNLTVDDGDGGNATDSVVVSVQNQPPTADAGADRTVEPGASVTLDGGGSDPDGDALTYAWTQEGGPAVTLISGTTATPRFTPTEAGTYMFRLTLTDAEGASDEDTVLVRVEAPFPVALALLPLLIVVAVLLALLVRRRRGKEPKTVATPVPPSGGELPEEWREEPADAGPPTASAEVTQAVEEPSVEDTAARLAELEQLKAEGIISDDYYASKRKEILGKL